MALYGALTERHIAPPSGMGVLGCIYLPMAGLWVRNMGNIEWVAYLVNVNIQNDHQLMINKISWWRHQMENFSALLTICAGNSPVPGEFPAKRPVTRSFDVFFGLRLNTRLSTQSWGWWFETLPCPLWRYRNASVSIQSHRFVMVWYRSRWGWLSNCFRSVISLFLEITTD